MPELVNATLSSVWKATLRQAPDTPALIADGRSWSRRELQAASVTFAANLPPTVCGRRVAFARPNGIGWFAAFLGLLEAGATPVPLDPAELAGTRGPLAESVGASFLLDADALVALKRLVPRRVNAPALIKLTSGSTGHPRALAFSHAQMLADGRQVCSTMDIRPDDRNLAVIPFGHSYGLGNLVLPLVIQGTSITCADTPLPHALAALSTRDRPTLFPAVPALLRALAEADLPADAFSSLRTVISAGSPLPASTARSFYAKFGLKPHGFYGSSETGGIAYDREGDDTLAGTSVGRALDGVRLTPVRGGRIRVQSAAVLRPAGHVPADRAEIDASGRLTLHGRAGRMIKIGGRRLDLGDLEAALRRLPGIVDAFAMPHPDDPEQIAAALATPLPSLSLRALLRENLPSWKIPRRLVLLASLPLTARGKPDPLALRKLLAK